MTRYKIKKISISLMQEPTNDNTSCCEIPMLCVCVLYIYIYIYIYNIYIIYIYIYICIWFLVWFPRHTLSFFPSTPKEKKPMCTHNQREKEMRQRQRERDIFYFHSSIYDLDCVSIFNSKTTTTTTNKKDKRVT